MMSEVATGLSNAIPSLLGVVVGFFLATMLRWWERKRKVKAHWEAIRAEMTLCKEKADTFLNTPVAAPLYRFPVMAMQTAFPILLTEGSLNEQEALAVGRYSSQVEDINRGLDYAASQAMDGTTVGLASQYNRLVLKTRDLIEAADGGRSIFEAAQDVVDGRLLLWRQLV